MLQVLQRDYLLPRRNVELVALLPDPEDLDASSEQFLAAPVNWYYTTVPFL